MFISKKYLLENEAGIIASNILNYKNNCVIDLQDYADYINAVLKELNIQNDKLTALIYVENNEPTSRVNNFDEYNYINAVCTENIPDDKNYFDSDMLNYMEIVDIEQMHNYLIHISKNYKLIDSFIKKLIIIARLKEYIFFIY